ncbi:MAG: methyltransferase domain-containing protein [Chloroflexota bacterium]|nr:methyltransferase domain-containing protein [Chloroflexota bacterium]
MEPKLHRRVQRYGWDLAVDDYDRHWVPVLSASAEHCVYLVAPQSGERVLDIASGTGIAAFIAAKRVSAEGDVVATDLSQKMVDAIQATAQREGIGNIRCERVDAEDLAYPDASFDAAVCSLGLMYPAVPQRAIEQMYRVLRPGGCVAVCVWGRRDRCGWNAIFPIVDARVNSDVCPLFFSLGGEGALSYGFERAGFSGISDERVTCTLDWKDGDEACDAALPGGPVALPYSRMTPEQRADVRAEYVASLEPYRREDGSYQVAGEFVYLVAMKPK